MVNAVAAEGLGLLGSGGGMPAPSGGAAPGMAFGGMPMPRMATYGVANPASGVTAVYRPGGQLMGRYGPPGSLGAETRAGIRPAATAPPPVQGVSEQPGLLPMDIANYGQRLWQQMFGR
jgi:hypothetical protein